MCLDVLTGEAKYRERGVGKGSAVYADGMLYCLGESGGRVGLVKPTPDGHELASSFGIPGGGKNVWAHPVVAGGRLYIRHQPNLFAYDIKAN